MNYKNFEKIIKYHEYLNYNVIKSQLKQFGRDTEVWRLKNKDISAMSGVSNLLENVHKGDFELIGKTKILLYSKGLLSDYVYNQKEITIVYYKEYFKPGDILRATLFNGLLESFQIKDPVLTAQKTVYQFIAVPINLSKWD